jgi:hypothetical protein
MGMVRVVPNVLDSNPSVAESPVEPFSLLLFSVDTALVRAAVKAGVSGIIVDWERAGKRARQAHANTEINVHTVEDLRAVRQATDGPVICRINAWHGGTAGEIDAAIGAGADELLLPMVRDRAEVEAALERVGGRRPLGILIETTDAVAHARELCSLPLARVYVGLNDLAIDRRAENIFEAVADGTVERVRGACGLPFGFGGLTLPECGAPIPCRLLIGEMARLSSRFSFLRRSFLRDIQGKSIEAEVPRLLEAIAAAGRRSDADVRRDQESLVAAIRRQPPSLYGTFAAPSILPA